MADATPTPAHVATATKEVAAPASILETIRGTSILVTLFSGVALVAGVRDPTKLSAFAAGWSAIFMSSHNFGSNSIEFVMVGGGIGGVMWSLYTTFAGAKCTNCKCKKNA